MDKQFFSYRVTRFVDPPLNFLSSRSLSAKSYEGILYFEKLGGVNFSGHPVIFVLLIFCSRIYFYHQKKNCNNILFVNWDNFICMTKLYTWQTKFWYLFFITQKIVAIIISDNLLLGQFFHDTYIMMTNIFNFFFMTKN